MFESFDDILSIEDVAKALKIGTTQVYKIVRSGDLKGYKEGKDWKIPKPCLVEYIQGKVNSSICKEIVHSKDSSKSFISGMRYEPFIQ